MSNVMQVDFPPVLTQDYDELGGSGGSSQEVSVEGEVEVMETADAEGEQACQRSNIEHASVDSSRTIPIQDSLSEPDLSKEECPAALMKVASVAGLREELGCVADPCCRRVFNVGITSDGPGAAPSHWVMDVGDPDKDGGDAYQPAALCLMKTQMNFCSSSPAAGCPSLSSAVATAAEEQCDDDEEEEVEEEVDCRFEALLAVGYLFGLRDYGL
jgi:hypothetical protein